MWTVEKPGQKLIVFLKERLPKEYSAKQIKKGIEKGRCLVNRRVEHFSSTVLKTGDTVEYSHLVEESSASLSLPILYEDQWLFAVDKPTGLVSEEKALQAYLPSALKKSFLVHRLDRETTGVLLFAKDVKTLEYFVEQFRQLQVKKLYLALIDGCPPHPQGVIQNELEKKESWQGQAKWGKAKKGGLFARTDWKILAKGKFASLLACYPKTGRTHQIRVHLSEMGYPLIGDHHYGYVFKGSFQPSRYFLHALKIGFVHPYLNKSLTITSHLPVDFKEALVAYGIAKDTYENFNR